MCIKRQVVQPVRSLAPGAVRDRDVARPDTRQRASAELVRVSGALIELDSTNAAIARDWIARIGVAFDIVEADAGTTDAYAGLVPADLVLLSGIMGNISAEDIERLIHVSRQFCAPGATVLWTRGAQELDLGQNIRRWFSEAGYAEIACQEGIEGTGMRVGVEQFTGAPEPLRPGEPVFTFYR